MLKDLMHAIFNEDVEEDDEEEVVEEPAKQEEVTPEPVVAEPQVQEEEVVKPEPILKEAESSIETDPENFMNSPIFEKAIIQPKPKKTTIFQGLDVDSIAQEEAKPKQKVYKYDRHKSVKVRRVAEDLDYQPVISPIFGNVEDSKKEFMLLGLRKIDGLKISEFKNKFGDNPIYLYRNELKKLSDEKLIIIQDDNIRLSNKGIDLANLVWEEFV